MHGDTHTVYVCQNLNGEVRKAASSMTLYHIPTLKYHNMEMYRTDDCTGEAFVDGIEE